MAVASVGWRARVRPGRSIRHERVRRPSAEPHATTRNPPTRSRERVVPGQDVDGRHCRPSREVRNGSAFSTPTH